MRTDVVRNSSMNFKPIWLASFIGALGPLNTASAQFAPPSSGQQIVVRIIKYSRRLAAIPVPASMTAFGTEAYGEAGAPNAALAAYHRGAVAANDNR
jgi:hypothetical protein